jgi:proteasome accessory factor B
MAARRAERLVNLVICLLSTRQFLTAERIRDAVPGYDSPDGSRATDEAFKRMFERDKAELRDLGIPLETGRNSFFETEDGYRISRRNYELPPIEFDAAEAAAVGLATRLWRTATLGEPARTALIKLRAAGTDVDPDATPGPVPTLDTSDPSLPAMLQAARTARVVRFAYQKSGSGTPETRTLEPWGVLSWHGRWYVAGRDRDRDAPRSFRLSRVIGPVTMVSGPGAFRRPPEVDTVALVSARTPDAGSVARVRVNGRAVASLRRMAEAESDGVLSIRYTDLSWLARQIASAGAAVTVLDPPELIDAVVTRLSAAVADSPAPASAGAAR